MDGFLFYPENSGIFALKYDKKWKIYNVIWR